MWEHAAKILKVCSDIETKFAVGITESQGKLPTFYWLPKLHKRPYKARFIANSSSCTTTSLSRSIKSKRKAMNRNWFNQKANPALNTKAGNK